MSTEPKCSACDEIRGILGIHGTSESVVGKVNSMAQELHQHRTASKFELGPMVLDNADADHKRRLWCDVYVRVIGAEDKPEDAKAAASRAVEDYEREWQGTLPVPPLGPVRRRHGYWWVRGAEDGPLCKSHPWAVGHWDGTNLDFHQLASVKSADMVDAVEWGEFLRRPDAVMRAAHVPARAAGAGGALGPHRDPTTPRDVLEAAHELRRLGCTGDTAVDVMVDAARRLAGGAS